jgi:hypothetical protein
MPSLAKSRYSLPFLDEFLCAEIYLGLFLAKEEKKKNYVKKNPSQAHSAAIIVAELVYRADMDTSSDGFDNPIGTVLFKKKKDVGGRLP